jgi:hypothetical protein
MNIDCKLKKAHAKKWVAPRMTTSPIGGGHVDMLLEPWLVGRRAPFEACFSECLRIGCWLIRLGAAVFSPTNVEESCAKPMEGGEARKTEYTFFYSKK